MAPDPRSKFLYDRSVQRSVAHVLADMRARCALTVELQLLDQIIKALVDEFSEDPTFDADDFCRRCRMGYAS